MVSAFGSSFWPHCAANRTWGVGRNWMRTSLGARGQVFARPQIKRHTGPAPIIDEQLEGDVGLDIGVGFDLRLCR